MLPESDSDKEAWHLSKGVPVAFIITLIIQSVVLVSWAATFKAEFVAFRDYTTQQMIQMKDYVDSRTMDRITSKQVGAEFQIRDERMKAIEKRDDQVFSEIQRMDTLIRQRLDRFESKLDKLVESASTLHGKRTN